MVRCEPASKLYHSVLSRSNIDVSLHRSMSMATDESRSSGSLRPIALNNQQNRRPRRPRMANLDSPFQEVENVSGEVLEMLASLNVLTPTENTPASSARQRTGVPGQNDENAAPAVNPIRTRTSSPHHVSGLVPPSIAPRSRSTPMERSRSEEPLRELPLHSQANSGRSWENNIQRSVGQRQGSLSGMETQRRDRRGAGGSGVRGRETSTTSSSGLGAEIPAATSTEAEAEAGAQTRARTPLRGAAGSSGGAGAATATAISHQPDPSRSLVGQQPQPMSPPISITPRLGSPERQSRSPQRMQSSPIGDGRTSPRPRQRAGAAAPTGRQRGITDHSAMLTGTGQRQGGQAAPTLQAGSSSFTEAQAQQETGATNRTLEQGSRPFPQVLGEMHRPADGSQAITRLNSDSYP